MLGLDLLGIGNKNWKIRPTIEAFPQGWALGAFARTFGDALPNVRRLLESGKVPAFRLQAWWANDHKIAPLDFLKSELPRWERLAKEYPHIKIYISHSCEYFESSVIEIKKRVDLVRSLCPSCTVVQTPMRSPTIPGFMTEEHGEHATARVGQIASTDGMNIFDIDSESWIRKNEDADIIFLWGQRFNLRENVKPPLTMPPPPDRTAFPSKGYIRGIVRLAFGSGVQPTPVFQGQVVQLKKPLLWKTFGEDFPGEGDKRANRPLIMLPGKSRSVQIVTFDGKGLGKLVYFDTFGPNLHRYYSGYKDGIGLYAWEIGELAKRESGYEWIWVKQGDRFYGPICAPYRTPFFQKQK